MDLYTLNEFFMADQPVDEFTSAIWTERYSEAGDVQLVVPHTEEWEETLKEGTMLACVGTDEVMQIETQNAENGLLTVLGNTLEEFLNERMVWNIDNGASSIDTRVVDRIETATAGQAIANVVEDMVIDTTPATGASANANLDWANEEIPYLTLGAIDTSGASKQFNFPIGPLYDSIKAVADQEGLGMSLYLDSADGSGYSLKFKTYRGVDHSTGGAGELVRFVPDLDTFSDVKSIRSIANYKNVAYVYFIGVITTYLADPLLPTPVGFDRRVLMVTPEIDSAFAKIPSGMVTAWKEQKAKDALANYNYVKALDGTATPNDDYIFGVHYGLGDIIELQAVSGSLSKARVTEYIRAEDQTGERAYPTLTVL